MTQTLPDPPDNRADAPDAPAHAPAARAAVAAATAPDGFATRAARLGVDWWAVIVAGAFVLLAVLDVLPTIGW